MCIRDRIERNWGTGRSLELGPQRWFLENVYGSWSDNWTKTEIFQPQCFRSARSSEALLRIGIKVLLVVFGKMRKQIESNGIGEKIEYSELAKLGSSTRKRVLVLSQSNSLVLGA